jgi:hypothetical protein
MDATLTRPSPAKQREGPERWRLDAETPGSDGAKPA